MLLLVALLIFLAEVLYRKREEMRKTGRSRT
jgi:hypothetical protein